ncbi:hypothetical protein HPB51_012104 [Rhipicephalus microplus]|uniref:Transposable element n=1 Tax=Rhipicephalus microplus TaxID=6941 RepID=A0A9J6DMI7_RHIMP|nr:hypothetical protein HPB51_012104 [Rhipicephalus microplus]
MKKTLLWQPIQRGSQDALWAAIKEQWKRLRASDLVTRLFDSLPRRMGAVVASGGPQPHNMAKSTTRLLEQLGGMLWEWPPQGADTNICENVRGAMMKTLSRQPIWRGSQDALWAAIKEQWKRLRASDPVTRLFDSLPRRMGAVVASGGEFTKY